MRRWPDHNRPGGTWTESDDLTRVVTKYWHHNPWVCANPPTRTEFGVVIEGPCEWSGALDPTGYTGNSPPCEAPHCGVGWS